MMKRTATAAKNNPESSDWAMEDIQVMNPTKQEDPNSVLFGVYGIDDWVTSTQIRRAIDGNKNTLIMEGTWLTDAGWKLSDFVMEATTRFNFMSMHRALLFMDWGFIEASVSRGKLDLELNGDPEKVVAFIAEMDGKLKRAENLIEWIYNSRGQSISMPLNYRAAIEGSYPWIKGTLEEYIDEYLNSAASVLILLGPPGTGKTTFIKNLIHRSGSDAKITYDERVMNDDSLFAHFIEGDTKFLIMEDADAFLNAREDGNTMMHRFLNVSDGLISADGKKLVFSTNLPSINHIDSALIRPGRCFDVLEFRALTRAEAKVVADKIGTELPDGNAITLAQLFNTQPSGKPTLRGVGFVSS